MTWVFTVNQLKSLTHILNAYLMPQVAHNQLSGGKVEYGLPASMM